MSTHQSTDSALTETSLPETETLKYVSRGKVRDLYSVHDGSDEYLLFVATDRISAFDVILNNGVPGKGALLTQISAFWFNRLRSVVANHLIATSLEEMPVGVQAQISAYWDSVLRGRTMLVRKAKVIPLEAIVRGYLTGSAWAEYRRSGTVHGIQLPEGMVESARFPEPIFTPSTKAEQGAHDENISPDQARALVGEEIYAEVERLALALYKEASAYALDRGLILADTKFEFGLVPHTSPSPSPSSTSTSTSPTLKTHTIILVDEALTPDSSRYWSSAAYTPGKPQPSFDKQYLRDWLTGVAGFRKGLESGPLEAETGESNGKGWEMTEEVVRGTKERYEEVVRMLVG